MAILPSVLLLKKNKNFEAAIFLGSLMSLVSPGFQLDGFPCIIGASKATANDEDEDKGKLRKASAQLRR